jgi:hypothetical protein
VACQGIGDRTGIADVPDAIPAAAVRALLGGGVPDTALLFCLRYRGRAGFQDPSPGVVQALRSSGVPVEPASRCNVTRPASPDDPLTESGSGRRVYEVWLADSLTRTSDGFEVLAGTYCGGLCAADGVVRLRHRARSWHGEFVVRGVD